MGRFVAAEDRNKLSELRSTVIAAGCARSHRVWCDVYADSILRIWREAYGVREYTGGVERLLSSRRELVVPSGNDHRQLWGRKRKPLVYTLQPYGTFDVVALGLWAQDHGLCIRAGAEPSWHFPGRTTLIEICTPETRALLDEYAVRKRPRPA